MNKIWNSLKKGIKNLCLVDRFLIVFVLVLFVYLIVQIFLGVNMSQDNDSIGVIVRTSLASIFGYFISSNFSGGSLPNSSQSTDVQGRNLPSESTNTAPSSHLKNQIGFETPPTQETGGISLPKESPPSTKRCGKIQVFIVASMGLVSLFILLATTKLPDVTTELTAIKSQLRDFVSACIGFLVSCGKNTAE